MSFIQEDAPNLTSIQQSITIPHYRCLLASCAFHTEKYEEIIQHYNDKVKCKKARKFAAKLSSTYHNIPINVNNVMPKQSFLCTKCFQVFTLATLLNHWEKMTHGIFFLNTPDQRIWVEKHLEEEEAIKSIFTSAQVMVIAAYLAQSHEQI